MSNDDTKSLKADSLLGHYRILEKLGVGGMGEVYLAEDSKLHRKVALKLLPESIASDKERRQRFEQEAIAASALNHPNILTVHEFGIRDGIYFLATEFVEGQTLREKLRHEKFTVDETLEIAIQTASALSAAHESGIIHRDIKPENIMLRRDSLVKVLDFGLAKITKRKKVNLDGEAKTQTLIKTAPGIVMGTVAYMSPEQARGRETGAGTDVFSFGVVLYEMLTGRNPFAGETRNDRIAAILLKEPLNPRSLDPGIPAELERIVLKALCKERKKRYRSAKDLLTDLKKLKRRREFETELKRINPSHKQTEEITQIFKTESVHSIAVLPFTNMSADAENEYFCEGLAEELLNALAKIEDLKVAARTSAFSFKNKNVEVGEIGKALNVKAILEGSVRHSGNRIRITVQLIDAANGYHLWSERFDREIKDIFDVQDEITLAVVDALKLKLFGLEKEAVLKRGTDDAEAYELYLRGLFYWNKRTVKGIRKAIDLFEQAVGRDPNYALGHVGLADSYALLEEYTGAPASEILPKARTTVDRALRIDNSSAEAHACSAQIYAQMWCWADAEKEYKRAISLNPNYPTAHHWLSIYYRVRRQFDDSLREIERARELDPLSPVINSNVAYLYLLKNDPSSAIEQLQRTVELDPSFPYGHNDLGLALLRQRHYAEAKAEFEKAVELSGRTGNFLSYLGYFLATLGKNAEARRILRELEEKYDRQETLGMHLAAIHSTLGDKDQAFAWLEKDFRQRSGLLPFITWWLNFEQLRPDPRYADMVRRMGLEP